MNSPAQISEYKIPLLLLSSKRISIGVVCKDVISKAAFCNTLPLLLSKPIRLGVVLSAAIRKMTALDKTAFIAPLLLRCYCCPNKPANAGIAQRGYLRNSNWKLQKVLTIAEQ